MQPLLKKTPGSIDVRHSQYQDVKTRIHGQLLNRLNLERLSQIRRDEAEPEIRSVIGSLLEKESETTPLSRHERENIVIDVLNELFGLGPLEALLLDTEISDILVNRFDQIYIEKNGKLEPVTAVFKDDRHLMRIIERIVSTVGRRIDESSPMVDARLLDGSRVNAIIPPLALDGPVLSIRRFRTDRLGSQELVKAQSITDPMMSFLKAAVGARLNILISGGTGAGKTTLLNVLSSFISESERIVTIEDAAELTLRQSHVIRLETRPANIEGKGAIKQRQLVINALRMRPDRIVVGEVRGDEAVDMLQAMNTGHDGSLTTIHANTPRDALYRLDTMVAMANLNLPDKAIRHQVASAIQLVIQIARMSDGTRRVTQVTEITGMEGDVITMQDIFVFERTGMTPAGKVTGRFRATGIRPKCGERIVASGRQLPAELFEHVHLIHKGEPMLLPVLVFAGVLLIVLGAYWLLVMRDEQRLLERLQPTPAKRGKRLNVLKPKESMSSVGTIDKALRTSRFTEPIQTFLDQAAVKATVSVFLLGSACAAMLFFLIGTIVARTPIAGAILAPLGGALPFLFVRRARAKRVRKFEEQFPEAIDLVARALRAGHALPTGLGMVADELKAPVGKEFRILYDEQNFGLTLPDALRNFARRVPVLDARFFVTAVMTQRETGGNLAEVLDNLGSVIRERFKVKRQVRVLSAHGRITGWVLAMLPPALAVATFVVSPSHLGTLLYDPLGQKMIVVAIVLQILGTLTIRKLVDIEY